MVVVVGVGVKLREGSRGYFIFYAVRRRQKFRLCPVFVRLVAPTKKGPEVLIKTAIKISTRHRRGTDLDYKTGTDSFDLVPASAVGLTTAFYNLHRH